MKWAMTEAIIVELAKWFIGLGLIGILSIFFGTLMAEGIGQLP